MTSFSAASYSSRRFFDEEWTPLLTRIPGGGRASCAHASLDDKRHFLFGGQDANGESKTVAEYSSLLQNWRTYQSLPEARSHFAATPIDDGRLLVVGGSSSSTRNSCVAFDTRSEERSTDWPLLNIARFHHTSAYTRNKKAYVIGGYNNDSIEEIDLSLPTPSWRVFPQRLKKKRAGCCAIAHPKKPNTIIVVGGYNGNDKYLCCCEIICLDQTQEGPSMMTPRAHHTLVLVENRFVVAMGGESNGSRAVSSVEYLDLEEVPQDQQQWRPLPRMETPRSLFAAFYCSENHKIVVAGGVDNASQMLDTVEELRVLFRGHARSRRQLREPPRPRDLPPVTINPHGPLHELLCPITHEVMVDPVITADGHTYERAAIQLVFQNTARGENPRSPVTGLLLPSRSLIPNIALRSMCMDYSETRDNSL